MEKVILQALTNYNLGCLQSVVENKVGRQTHYIIVTSKGKYFIKVLDCNNENIHINDEILACTTLKQRGIRAIPTYMQRTEGSYVTQMNDYTYFNVQKFIEGDKWKKYQAPDWLLFQAVDFIADVHSNLQDLRLPQRGAIMRINDNDEYIYKLAKIRKSIKLSKANDKDFLLKDIALRQKILDSSKFIDLSNLTFANGHGDYTVTQVITETNKIAGVIDFSEVSNIPVIWEIMRFYLNSAPECKEQRVDEERFSKYMKVYTQKVQLNDYDKEVLFEFSLRYFAQAISIYDKLLESDFSQRYMERIISRNNTIKCLQTLKKIS
jgi:Ser/Thr protein kinase RdoA (MazF antagonist)